MKILGIEITIDASEAQDKAAGIAEKWAIAKAERRLAKAERKIRAEAIARARKALHDEAVEAMAERLRNEGRV